MNKTSFIGIVSVIAVAAYVLSRRANAAISYNPVYYPDSTVYPDDLAQQITQYPTTDYQTETFPLDTTYGDVVDYGDQMPIFDTGMTMPTQITKLTRGERNNNPGNIRKSASQWQGLTPDQSKDSDFAQFVSPQYGIRAMTVLLKNYFNRDGLRTVQAIVNKYAPPKENVTTEYVKHVAALMGVSANTQLNLNDPATLAELVSAMITHENGRNIYADNGILDTGVGMA